MKLEYHPEARAEALDAAAYIEERRPGYGTEFKNEIREALRLIGREPKLWAVRLHGFRRCVTPRFKYQVWYRERGDSIYVISVHHSSREPGYWKERI